MEQQRFDLKNLKFHFVGGLINRFYSKWNQDKEQDAKDNIWNH